MRQTMNSVLALASFILPGAVMAADYNQNSSSGNAVQVDIINSGSTSKTGINLSQLQPYATGLLISVGNGYGGATGSYVGHAGVGDYNTGYSYFADGRVDGEYGTYNGLYTYSWAQGYSSTNYGVFAQAGGTSDTYNYGVWATGYVYGSGGFGAAGYFSGDAWAYAFPTISDQKFKKDVKDVSGGLDKIMALKPKTYAFKQEEYKDRMNFDGRTHIGFIAQEVETVLPELVVKGYEPARLTEEERKNGVKKEGIEFKGVDYTGVIPVLVKAVQEQQAEIASLRAEVASLKAAK